MVEIEVANGKAILPPLNALLGIEGKYEEWYPGQDVATAAILEWLKSSKRFFGLSAATGAGKSAIAMAVSKQSDFRSAFLTVTKGLQEQIYRDFRELGMVDIRGQNNYQCVADVGSAARLTADEGPCREGYNCPHKGMGCPYYEKLRGALRAKRVITNYYYYLAQTHYADGLGDFRLAIMDEGHLVHGALENHLSTSFSKDELEAHGCRFPSAGFASWEKWRSWARGQAGIVGELVATYKEQIEERRQDEDEIPPELSKAHRRAGGLEKRLLQVADGQGEWVQEKWKSNWRLTPVWIADYGRLLFGNVPKIVIMSAVLTEKTMESIGVPMEQTEFLEMPSYFPKENNPIYHVPTVRMNWRTDKQELGAWVSRIDQIIGSRLDRKGIVFTVSYKRRDFLLEKSRYREIMVSHGTRDVVEQVRQFKRSRAPSVFVSPAVTSGWSFDHSEARYVIVGKLPYPDTTNPVMKARQEIDRNWTTWMAMDALVQECGRIMRAPNDWGEVILVDDSWYWFWKRHQDMAPMWFRDRVLGTVDVIPEPLEIGGSA